MEIITIARKLGSLGEEIGRKVADRLGYRYVSTARAGKILSGVSEQEIERLDEKTSALLDPRLLRQRRFVHLLNQSIRSIALKGRAVIVGRGVQCLLHRLPGAFHVKLVCPLNYRAQRVMAAFGISEREALQRVLRNDREMAAYSRCLLGSHGAECYDLIVDTEGVSAEVCAAQIIEGADAMKRKTNRFLGDASAFLVWSR